MQYFSMLVKEMFKVGDETKHVLLFIFHALYICLTVEEQKQRKRDRKRMDPL